MKIRCRVMDVPYVGLVLMPDDSDAQKIRSAIGDGPAKVQVEAQITRLVQIDITGGRKEGEI